MSSKMPSAICCVPVLNCVSTLRCIAIRLRASPWRRPRASQGVSWAQMKDILIERHIQPRLGGETVEEAEQEVQTLRAYFQDHP